jgi:hypothetical protein
VAFLARRWAMTSAAALSEGGQKSMPGQLAVAVQPVGL